MKILYFMNLVPGSISHLICRHIPDFMNFCCGPKEFIKPRFYCTWSSSHGLHCDNIVTMRKGTECSRSRLIGPLTEKLSAPIFRNLYFYLARNWKAFCTMTNRLRDPQSTCSFNERSSCFDAIVDCGHLASKNVLDLEDLDEVNYAP